MSIQLKTCIRLLPLFCISAEKLFFTLSQFFVWHSLRIHMWIIFEKAHCLRKNTFDLAITAWQIDDDLFLAMQS